MKRVWPALLFGAVLVPGIAVEAFTAHHQRPTSVSVSPAPAVSMSPHASPYVTSTSTPAPAYVNKRAPHVHVSTLPPLPLPPDDRGSQKGTAVDTVGPEPPQASGGIWTPYNSHCFADCFPDLTAERQDAAIAWYQGSFEGPAETPGGEPVFKGLSDVPLINHYACEYFHVIGFMPAFKDCAGVLE